MLTRWDKIPPNRPRSSYRFELMLHSVSGFGIATSFFTDDLREAERAAERHRGDWTISEWNGKHFEMIKESPL